MGFWKLWHAWKYSNFAREKQIYSKCNETGFALHFKQMALNLPYIQVRAETFGVEAPKEERKSHSAFYFFLLLRNGSRINLATILLTLLRTEFDFGPRSRSVSCWSCHSQNPKRIFQRRRKSFPELIEWEEREKKDFQSWLKAQTLTSLINDRDLERIVSM